MVGWSSRIGCERFWGVDGRVMHISGIFTLILSRVERIEDIEVMLLEGGFVF